MRIFNRNFTSIPRKREPTRNRLLTFELSRRNRKHTQMSDFRNNGQDTGAFRRFHANFNRINLVRNEHRTGHVPHRIRIIVDHRGAHVRVVSDLQRTIRIDAVHARGDRALHLLHEPRARVLVDILRFDNLDNEMAMQEREIFGGGRTRPHSHVGSCRNVHAKLLFQSTETLSH